VLPAVRKTVFIDFDGTFAANGVIPAAHIRAVREAQRNGHRVLLCTGRPRALVAEDERAVFDGLVAAAGGYVELDGEVLADRRFPAELAARLVQLLDANGAAYIMEAPDAVSVPPGVLERLETLLTGGHSSDLGKAGRDILAPLQTTYSPATQSFAKVTCFDAAIPTAWIAAELAPEVSVVPSSIGSLGETAGEFYLTGVDKSVGIEVVARRYGLSRDDIVAIGDGHNDLEMLEYAGTGVAIEGSAPELLALADLVVPKPEHEGLVVAFERLGLIEASQAA
jgi:Cof subfamily protein (haloacid dehalogenase superfamily)